MLCYLKRYHWKTWLPGGLRSGVFDAVVIQVQCVTRKDFSGLVIMRFTCISFHRVCRVFQNGAASFLKPTVMVNVFIN